MTLCDTWAIALQAPLSMRFPKQEHRSGFPVFFFPVVHFLLKGIFQTQGLNPTPWLAGGFFTTQPPGKLGRGWFLLTWFSTPGGLGVVLVSRTKKLPEGGSCEPLAASTHTNSECCPRQKGNRGHQSSVFSMTGFLSPPLETLLLPYFYSLQTQLLQDSV